MHWTQWQYLVRALRSIHSLAVLQHTEYLKLWVYTKRNRLSWHQKCVFYRPHKRSKTSYAAGTSSRTSHVKSRCSIAPSDSSRRRGVSRGAPHTRQTETNVLGQATMYSRASQLTPHVLVRRRTISCVKCKDSSWPSEPLRKASLVNASKKEMTSSYCEAELSRERKLVVDISSFLIILFFSHLVSSTCTWGDHCLFLCSSFSSPELSARGYMTSHPLYWVIHSFLPGTRLQCFLVALDKGKPFYQSCVEYCW